MSTEIAKLPTAEAIEKVLIAGDLSVLSEPQRLAYYKSVCASVGLNPLTQPLQYIRLNGKLVLYAAKGCTDQLRQIYGVSVTDLTTASVHGVYVVSVKVANKEGRTDMATGAVALDGLKGEALANALMKTETKAKRRATLSICGLSLLDETEVETIPGAQKMAPQEAQQFVAQEIAKLKAKADLNASLQSIPKDIDDDPGAPEPIVSDVKPYEEQDGEARIVVAKIESPTGTYGPYRKVFWDGGFIPCYVKSEYGALDLVKPGYTLYVTVAVKGGYKRIMQVLRAAPPETVPAMVDDASLFVSEGEGVPF